MDHVSYGTRDEVQLAAYKYGTTSSLQSTQGAFPTAHHIVLYARRVESERAHRSAGSPGGSHPGKRAARADPLLRMQLNNRVALLACVHVACALHLGAPQIRRANGISMDASWRPKTVDPLGQVMGAPTAAERSYEYWLDLRTAEVSPRTSTFFSRIVRNATYFIVNAHNT